MAKLLMALLLLTLTLSAMAAPETALYEGKAAADSSLAIAPWGAGSGQDSTAVYLFGGHSLQITTLDMHQGAQVSFASPVPLGVEPGRYFQITIRRGTPTLHYDPGTLPGATPAPTNPTTPAGGMPGMGMPGMGMPGMGMPGVPGMGMPGMGFPMGTGGMGTGRRGRRGRGNGNNPPNTPEAPQIPPIKNLRLLFTLSDGRQADILRPIPETGDPTVGEGWYSVNVPLTALKFPAPTDAAGATLKSVTIGGDQYGLFYIGRMRLATDTAPITASIEGAASVVAGDEIALRAKANGGLSDLAYAWNFGETGDTAVQATGMETMTTYQTAGKDYTVTLTVSDRDGLKKPVQATKVIHVTEEQPQTQPGMGIPGMGIPGTGIPGMGTIPIQP